MMVLYVGLPVSFNVESTRPTPNAMGRILERHRAGAKEHVQFLLIIVSGFSFVLTSETQVDVKLEGFKTTK